MEKENVFISNLKNLCYFKSPYIISLILVIILSFVGVYDSFYLYESLIVEFLKDTIFAFIGILGFLLSAITFLLGLLDKNVLKELNNLNKYDHDLVKNIKEEFNLTNKEFEKPMDSIVKDFIFIGIIIFIQIIFNIIMLIFINSNLNLINRIYFYIVSFFLFFNFLYIIRYLIRLLKHSYSIFKLFIKLEEFIEQKKNIRNKLDLIAKELESVFKNEKMKFSDEDIMIGVIKVVNDYPSEVKNVYYEEIKQKYNITDEYLKKIEKNIC